MEQPCAHCPLPASARCPGARNAGICRRVAQPGQEAFRAAIARRATAFPPLAEQAGNLAGAVGRFVASGLERTTPEEKARRMAICGGCDQFAEGRCRLCGCRLAAKIAMLSEHCPLSPPKW